MVKEIQKIKRKDAKEVVDNDVTADVFVTPDERKPVHIQTEPPAPKVVKKNKHKAFKRERMQRGRRWFASATILIVFSFFFFLMLCCVQWNVQKLIGHVQIFYFTTHLKYLQSFLIKHTCCYINQAWYKLFCIKKYIIFGVLWMCTAKKYVFPQCTHFTWGPFCVRWVKYLLYKESWTDTCESLHKYFHINTLNINGIYSTQNFWVWLWQNYIQIHDRTGWAMILHVSKNKYEQVSCAKI